MLYVPMTVEIEVDQRVFDAVLTDEWRAQYYRFHTPEEVGAHLAYNLIQGRTLSSLDGFADLPDDLARVIAVAEIDEGDVQRGGCFARHGVAICTVDWGHEDHPDLRRRTERHTNGRQSWISRRAAPSRKGKAS